MITAIFWGLVLAYILWEILKYLKKNATWEPYSPEPLKQAYTRSYVDDNGYRRYKHNDCRWKYKKNIK